MYNVCYHIYAQHLCETIALHESQNKNLYYILMNFVQIIREGTNIDYLCSIVQDNLSKHL